MEQIVWFGTIVSSEEEKQQKQAFLLDLFHPTEFVEEEFDPQNEED